MSEKKQTGKSSFGARLKQLREMAGMTQPQLAEKSGVSLSAIGKYERMEREPKTEYAIKLAEALNVSPSELLGFGTYMAYQVEHDADGLKKEVTQPGLFGDDFFQTLKDLLRELDLGFASARNPEEMEIIREIVDNITECLQLRHKLLDVESDMAGLGSTGIPALPQYVDDSHPYQEEVTDYHQKAEELSIRNIENARDFNEIALAGTRYSDDSLFYRLPQYGLKLSWDELTEIMDAFFNAPGESREPVEFDSALDALKAIVDALILLHEGTDEGH